MGSGGAVVPVLCWLPDVAEGQYNSHTWKGCCTLGWAVLAGRVAELLPDVLQSATAISTASSSIVHSIQVTQCTAEAMACGRLFLTDLLHSHQLLCAAALSASDGVCCCSHTLLCVLQDYLANAYKCLLLTRTRRGMAAKPLPATGVC